MFKSANRALAKFSRTALIVLAFTVLVLIGILDYLTGYEISFAVFYLVPVGAAAWYAGRPAGVGFALGSSLVWYVAESAGGYPYRYPAVLIWNAFVRFGFFLIIAMLLSSLRDHLATVRQLAKTDALTGVPNSRAFTAQLEHDLALTKRTGNQLTLAYIDLDDFKRINDTYGHGEGDRLLRIVGQTLIEGTRRTDTVARLGGDEFALVLPGTDLDGAQSLILNLRQLLNESLATDGQAISCSIGAVVFLEQPRNADEAIAAADRLMYIAKASGKKTVIFGIYSGSVIETVQPVSAVDAPQATHR